MNETIVMKNVMQLENIFKENPKLNLWVFEYGITHRFIKFILFEENFFDRVEVYCIGCTFFKGELQGGPYRLFLEEGESNNDDSESFVIRSENQDLIFNIEEVTKIAPLNYVEPDK